ncbi:MAG: DNA polymerase [Xanthobacteraceae bacterium]
MSLEPKTEAERAYLLDYCQSDVDTAARLFEKMLPRLDLAHALLRGRYTVAAAKTEHVGTPVNVPAYTPITENWGAIGLTLIRRMREKFGIDIHDENGGFKFAKFEQFVTNHKLPWKRTKTGRLCTDEETFSAMKKVFPIVQPLAELKYSIGQLNLNDLSIGSDGRNRTGLSIFRASTSRNAPSSAKFLFNNATWLRHRIAPSPGYGLAYLDYKAQEFAIAAARSGDKAMMACYRDGDPYEMFARLAGMWPSDPSQRKTVREQFKVAALAMMYGQEARSMAQKLGVATIFAEELVRIHHHLFPQFWVWLEEVMDKAACTKSVSTVFAWPARLHPAYNKRALRNFLMQANGAEILRLACCLITENGIRLCAPIHDAVLIEAPLGILDEHIDRTKAHMIEAANIVLRGKLELRVDTTIVSYPDHYREKRGQAMWETVNEVLAEYLGATRTAHG